MALAVFIPMAYLYSDGPRSSGISTYHGNFWNVPSARVTTSTEFWEWSRTKLASTVFKSDVSGTPVVNAEGGVTVSFSDVGFPSLESPTIISGTDMVLIGSVRLQQFRVNKVDCPTTFVYSSISETCSAEFDMKSNNNKGVYFRSEYPLYLEPAFTWSSEYSGSTMFSNRSGITYPTDCAGFHVDLTPSLPQSTRLLQDLESNNWIDSHTAAIIVSVNTYHPVQDAFVSDRLVFEFTEAGALWSSMTTETLPSSAIMFSETSTDAITQLALAVVNLVWFTVACVWFLYLMVTVRKRLFTFLWTYFDLLLLVMLSLYIYVRSKIYVVMMTWVIGPEAVFGQPRVFYPLSAVAPAYQHAIVCQTTALAIVFIRLNKFAPLASPRINFAAFHIHTVIGLMVISIYILVGFSLSYYVSLGFETSTYARWQDAMAAVALSLINVMWITKTEGSGAFFALLWIFLVYLVIAPLLICLSIQGFTTIAATGPSVHNNPIAVYIRARIDALRGRAIVSDTSQHTQGLELDAMPSILRKRIIAMRRTLRFQVEVEFGRSAVNFDDYNEWVSLTELRRILAGDPIVCKLLGTLNAEEVLRSYKSDSGIAVGIENQLEKRLTRIGKSALDLAAKMTPEVSSISADISTLVRQLRNQMDKDLEPLLGTVSAINKTIEDLDAKASKG